MRFVETPGWHDAVDELKTGLLERVSSAVAADASAFAPKDTGAMAASIHATVVDPSTAIVEADAPALWIEEGHRVAYRDRDGKKVYTGTFVEPRPFLRPALNADRTDDL